ncbi:MAG: DUF2007 domain-containing protein [Oceanococcus sp.]
MKPLIVVYSAPSLPTVAWLHERLSDAGIRCMIRNEFLSAGAGELPPHETWPSLCLFDDKDEARAKQMVAELSDTSQYDNLPDWECLNCGASNGAILGFCWQCQAADNQDRAF